MIRRIAGSQLTANQSVLLAMAGAPTLYPVPRVFVNA